MAALGNFLGQKKCFLLPFFYLLIDLRKLWTKISGLISYFTGCMKKLHLVKKSLFIPDLCMCPINLILLCPLISYFLPKIFIFQLQVSEHTKTNILSYYNQKSVCKQKSYSFQKYSGNLTLKNHCQLFFTYIHLFSFSKVSILYGEYEIKTEIQYQLRFFFFSEYKKSVIF